MCVKKFKRERSLSERTRNVDMKDASGLKREKCKTRKRHLIARATFPFDNFFPREIYGVCRAATALPECSTLTSLVTSCRAYLLLSPVIGMHVRWQATRARGGEGDQSAREAGRELKEPARRSCTRRSPGVRRG